MLISDIVRRNAAYFGDAEALHVPGGRSSTWTEMDERTNRCARALLDLGLVKGDRLSAFMPNCGEYLDFYFSCAKSGIIGAALNIRLTAKELGSYLATVEPSAILVHADLAAQASELIARVPSIRHVIGVGPDHGFDLDLEALLAAQEPTDPGCDVDEHDLYQLGATSGTTGIPKAAMLSHRNAIAAISNWMAETWIPEMGTCLQTIPYFFNPGGPSGMQPVLMKGGRSIIPPAFEAGSFMRLVEEHRVTHSILVPTMIGMVLNHPDRDKYDLSSLKVLMCGGSSLSREQLIGVQQLFGRRSFYPQFGMAETYSCGTLLRPEDQITDGTPEQVKRLASVGKPHVLMQMRVVDAEGKDVPHDDETPGELWVKGDTVSSGYFRMPEETAGSREGEWFKSGDIGVVDPEGFITIVDRAKDIIITGGINVYSRDIEDALYEHPAVLQAAAIGIPHEVWGEAIHAVVTLKAGTSATEEELMAFAAERLAGFKKPRSIEIVEALPISGTGKILKRELRAQHQPR
ncbi:MAG: AMP-binding protein [Acidimicrobiia bacterium]